MIASRGGRTWSDLQTWLRWAMSAVPGLARTGGMRNGLSVVSSVGGPSARKSRMRRTMSSDKSCRDLQVHQKRSATCERCGDGIETRTLFVFKVDGCRYGPRRASSRLVEGAGEDGPRRRLPSLEQMQSEYVSRSLLSRPLMLSQVGCWCSAGIRWL